MSRASRIAGVLLDVGGTLWPERGPGGLADGAVWPVLDSAPAAEQSQREARIGAALGSFGPATMRDLVGRLEAEAGAALAASYDEPGNPWDVSAIIRTAAQGLRIELDDHRIVAVRRAMALPAAGRTELLPHAQELLATIRALRLSCVLLSNTVWRDAEVYRRDFDDFGVSRFIDGIVTSVDCGFRKPDQRAFDAALSAVNCRAIECVMIGNSEENDVAPALTLGMRAIRVAIEEPRPPRSAAHAIAGSLHEAAEVLRSWVWSDTGA